MSTAPVSFTPTTSSALASAAGSATSQLQLGSDAFLKLLVAQMQNQDPLNPTTNTEFVAQLAQLSNLGATQQVNTNLSSLLLLQQLTQGASLVGKPIVYDKGGGVMAQGVVGSVQVSNGQLQLLVGGNPVSLSQVQAIQSPQLAPKTS